MKKSEFKTQIKNEIVDILEAEGSVSTDDPKAAEDLAKKGIDVNLTAVEEGNDQDDGYVNHTYDDSVIDKYNIPVEPTAVFEKDNDDEDVEPTAAQLKKEPLSKIGYKLADTQKEMKQVVKKWSAAEGSEKEKLYDRLRTLNNIKKELESLLENKR